VATAAAAADAATDLSLLLSFSFGAEDHFGAVFFPGRTARVTFRVMSDTDEARRASLESAAAEVVEVFETLGYEAYAKAAGLRNAIRSGLSPPPQLVAAVHEALHRALEAAAKESSSPDAKLDAGATRATRSTIRGVLKRFEGAFGTGPKSGQPAASR
jgi:hypothetical protein